jgi:hypothetical protein
MSIETLLDWIDVRGLGRSFCLPLFTGTILNIILKTLILQFNFNLKKKNTYGEFCEKSTLTNNDPCISKPCYNMGTCNRQDELGYTCSCNNTHGSTFTGVDCKLNQAGACASNPCLRDGICYPIGQSDYRCHCPDWTVGKNCEVIFNPCSRVNCRNNGACSKKRTLAYQCKCESDYIGPQCAQLASATCERQGCVYGRCVLDLYGLYRCMCVSEGYEGEFCEIDKCKPNCKFGICQRDSDSGRFYCQCSSLYKGADCSELVCFAGTSLIETSKGTKPVSQLEKGDLIRSFDLSTNKWIFSRFITFLHSDSNVTAEFISIKTRDDKHLLISPNHLIAKLNRNEIEFIFAKELKIGDFLIIENDQNVQTEIVSVNKVHQTGAFAPLTQTGTISVNGILASCYANTKINHKIVHTIFQPIIVWEMYFVDYFNSFSNLIFNNNNDTYDKSSIYWFANVLLGMTNYLPFKIIY